MYGIDEYDSDAFKRLVTRAYYAARDGMAIALYNLLSDQPQEQIDRLINQTIVEEDEEKRTILIVAAENGRELVVRMLLDKFKPDLEREGTVKYDGTVIVNVTALLCAACGHLTVIKSLVKAGANVNHATERNVTPLLAACTTGRLDVVKYLVEHNANVNICNSLNSSCLIAVVSKRQMEIVSFLLEKGANPNKKVIYGNTPLHAAAISGSTEIFATLLKAGAEMTKNDHGMTPLMTAADNNNEEVVEYIIDKVGATLEEAIDAYELLGASYTTHERNNCFKFAYMYLHKAMTLRYCDPNNVRHKVLGDTVPAYENWRECETLESLESIEHNMDAIENESFAIRERILGQNNPTLADPIMQTAINYATIGRLDRSIDLIFHGLKIRQLNNVWNIDDLGKFIFIFSKMFKLGMDLDLSHVLTVAEAVIPHLKSHNEANKNKFKSRVYSMKLTVSTLYLLTILSKLLSFKEEKWDRSNVDRAYQIVQRICATEVRLLNSKTLLHLAVNADTPIFEPGLKDICRYPCIATVNLLIRCGANVNAMDRDRNTPLHIIASYTNPVRDFTTLHTIMVDLIEAGAHMDIVNAAGKTPYDIAKSNAAKSILRSQRKLSLKCMAANVVKLYNLFYIGTVPKTLESFIELHGPGFN